MRRCARPGRPPGAATRHARFRGRVGYSTVVVRYRFIVARDNAKLYEHLVRSFTGVPDIEVILDRRESERRAARVRRMGRERRLRERRTETRVQEDLRLFGWAFMRVDTPPPGAPGRPVPLTAEPDGEPATP